MNGAPIVHSARNVHAKISLIRDCALIGKTEDTERDKTAAGTCVHLSQWQPGLPTGDHELEMRTAILH